MKPFILIVALSYAWLVSPNLVAAQMVVHEWGTFTCLQDETDRAIGGINTDDEPVPAFVHRIRIPVANSNLVQLTEAGKGIFALYPPVTMRLETPVIYFHRTAGAPATTVKVDVAFHGGWLTEFYPRADATAPGLWPMSQADSEQPLTAKTIGSLSWPAVRLGAEGTVVSTAEKVWTTPRQVHADLLCVGGEAERFLFYRGVGCIDSPLQVKRAGITPPQLLIGFSKANAKLSRAMTAELAHVPMWLVHVTPGGVVEWHRGYSPADQGSDKSILGVMDGRFSGDPSDRTSYKTGLGMLHADMSAALVKAGLYPDEAEAMLNTWEASYFKSPGLRLFYLLPQTWTDKTLPLHITGVPRPTRVMIGRVELITPEQRALIQTIKLSSPNAQPDEAVWSAQKALYDGKPLAEVAQGLSPVLRAYVLLGRFRDPILLDEQSQRPAPALATFLRVHNIRAADHPE